LLRKRDEEEEAPAAVSLSSTVQSFDQTHKSLNKAPARFWNPETICKSFAKQFLDCKSQTVTKRREELLRTPVATIWTETEAAGKGFTGFQGRENKTKYEKLLPQTSFQVPKTFWFLLNPLQFSLIAQAITRIADSERVSY
jgi:hypothetical protein